MSAASSGARRSPATAPTIRPGRRCSTSTRWPRPRASPGSIRACSCLPPDERCCLVCLSDGGRDANVVREFDLRERRFVEGGFALPEGKQNVTWEDANTILVVARLGAGDDDRLRLSVRGQAPAARPVARPGRGGLSRRRPRTCGVSPMVLRDSDGRVHGVGAYRGVDFFHRQIVLFRPGGNVDAADPAARLASPASSTAGCW